MAQVLGLFSYRVKDSEGIIVSKELYATFDDASTIVQIQAFSDAYTAVLDPLTEGQITKARFAIILGRTGLKTSPLADSDDQETLLTSYTTTVPSANWSDDVPAEIDAVIVNGRVDLTNAVLVAYKNFLIGAHAGFQAASRTGDVLISLISGVETFRTKRKQLNAKSKTTA